MRQKFLRSFKAFILNWKNSNFDSKFDSSFDLTMIINESQSKKTTSSSLQQILSQPILEQPRKRTSISLHTAEQRNRKQSRSEDDSGINESLGVV